LLLFHCSFVRSCHDHAAPTGNRVVVLFCLFCNIIMETTGSPLHTPAQSVLPFPELNFPFTEGQWTQVVRKFDTNATYEWSNRHEYSERFQVDTQSNLGPEATKIAKAAWVKHKRILLSKIHDPDPFPEIINKDDIKKVASWKHYYDPKSGKVERLIPLLIGVTVKYIQENEADGKLSLDATLTLKMPIDPRFKQDREVLNTPDMKGWAKEFLEGIHLNLNREGSQTLTARNIKLNQDTKENLNYSISGHIHIELGESDFVDCCPFNIAVYNLSIKVDGEGPFGTARLVWMSRKPYNFIQFQHTSIGSSVTPKDSISIFPQYKKEDDIKDFKLQPQIPDSHVKFDEVISEMDEIVFSFQTKSNHLKNFTNIVLPCMMVPIIVSLSTDREDKIQLLMAALLTLVFTMPRRFKFGTTIWYLNALVLTVIAYRELPSQISIGWISLIVTFVLIVIAFLRQRQIALAVNRIPIRCLIKDAAKQNILENIWAYFSLD
jgi:hypothetical protein